MNGLDWRTIGWAEYQTTLAGWNAGADTEKGSQDIAGLERFMAAHTLQ